MYSLRRMLHKQFYDLTLTGPVVYCHFPLQLLIVSATILSDTGSTN